MALDAQGREGNLGLIATDVQGNGAGLFGVFCVSIFAAGAASQAVKPAIAVEAKKPTYGLDTPIATLVADPRAKAILDKVLPGLTTHPLYAFFKNMSLIELQPLAGGLITEERLTTVEAALRGLDG